MKRCMRWLLDSLSNALVSAIVAALVGIITAYLWNQYQASLENKFFTIGDDTGIAYPALLFNNAIEEGFKIEFQPKDLQQIAVCEYNHFRGRTWEELVFKYLNEYKECFIVRKTGKKSIVISPNKHSKLLIYDNNKKKWLCRCPESMQ